jgi:hypothetical protein
MKHDRSFSAERRLPAAGLITALLLLASPALEAKPEHRRSLKAHYGSFLSSGLEACSTCHLRREEVADEESFRRKPPHNAFGARLRELGEMLAAEGKEAAISVRLELVAEEDADGDGVANEIEILAGHVPGDAASTPGPAEVAAALERRRELREARRGYPWEPFRRVERPLPPAAGEGWARNPIDRFIAHEHEKRGLRARPEAPPHVLLRRAYLDLVGLPPRPEELREFLANPSEEAYEEIVDRLLASPQHGERWGRHWMDIWRYSDWAGWGQQVRDSQPHIWRWRDWIIESLNADRGYDRMLVDMLAADELSPEDPEALRATGYLARSFKLLSREQWMQEAVNHTAQAFLGLTAGCARCHDHVYDPILQEEYYRLRAVFEPYNVRIDRLPGEPDTAKDGLARVFDANPAAPTYVFERGDDRKPLKEAPVAPGVPAALGGPPFEATPVKLPLLARAPDRRPFVIAETLCSSREEAAKAKAEAESAREKAAEAGRELDGEGLILALKAEAAGARHEALVAVVRVEEIEGAVEEQGDRAADAAGRAALDAAAWKAAAFETTARQRALAQAEARLELASAELEVERARAKSESAAAAAAGAEPKAQEAAAKAAAALEAARKRLAEAEKKLAAVREALDLPPSTEYRKRDLKLYPAETSGRRLALARWITSRDNPLAARVAANHIWARHFGRPLLPTVADFGRNGKPPSHPALLDWLAAKLMEPPADEAERGWTMKRLHRLIVTSRTYRLASSGDAEAAAIDPDNLWFWRAPERRMEAEAVRDAILHVAGRLDPTLGGPEIDHALGLTSRRRSLYFRHAAEKQMQFLRLFDAAAVTECYERKESIAPQQALALANSELTRRESRLLARALEEEGFSGPAEFAGAAFERVLSRPASERELELSLEFLAERSRLPEEPPADEKASAGRAPRARESLVHVLFNHNDFITVR